MQYSMVAKLSGGERRRLYLMTILMKNPNFLILDEPTNDLDIMTLNILEEYLQTFKGCVIIVSHDRYFMDKIVDNVFVFEENGTIKVLPGNFSDYSAWQAQKIKDEKKEFKKEVENKTSVESSAKKKATFKEKKEYEQLNADIEQLSNERHEIESVLSSGNASSTQIQEKSIRLNQVISLLDEKEMRWLELSELID